MISKKLLLLLTIILLTTAQDNESNSPSEDNVIVMDNNSLQPNIFESQDPWLLDMYASWCSHCVQMSEQWAKLATNLKGRIKVGKIDAALYPQFNDQFGLKGFPHIVFIPGGKKDKSVYYKHAGTRTAEAFERWALLKVNEHKRSFLHQLTDEEKWKQVCLGPHSDFCTVFFLPSIENSSVEEREFYLKIINELTKKFGRQPVSWLWAQAGDHKGLEKQFGISDSLPKIVLVNPSGKRFSVMPKSFTEDDFTQWMKNVLDIEFTDLQNDLVFGKDMPKSQSSSSTHATNEL